MLPGFAPAGEALLFRQKAQKPMAPRPASIKKRRDARLRRADQLAPLIQGPPADESVPPLGQTAGVGADETTISVTPMEERKECSDLNINEFMIARA